MIARASVLVFLAALCCVASWLHGYREGQQTGAYDLVRQMDKSYDRDIKNNDDMNRDEVCNEIRAYKKSIARDLDENTQICGWRDMDGPEISN
jgi:hypothetical protein